jgi:hypothetical protein
MTNTDREIIAQIRNELKRARSTAARTRLQIELHAKIAACSKAGE